MNPARAAAGMALNGAGPDPDDDRIIRNGDQSKSKMLQQIETLTAHVDLADAEAWEFAVGHWNPATNKYDEFRRHTWRHIEELIKAVQTASTNGLCVWIGHTVRRCPKGRQVGRCGCAKPLDKAHVVRALAAFADLDVGTEKAGHETVAEALEAAEMAPVPPTYIVGSGTGIHPVWVFEKPEVDIERVERLLRAICTRLKGDQAAKDCTRVLRISGTSNHKYGPDGLPVNLVKCTGRRYSVESLEAAFGPASVRGDEVQPPASQTAVLPADWPAQLADDAGLSQIWNATGKTGGDTSPSGFSFDLTTWLVRDGGYSDDQIHAIQQAHYANMGRPPKHVGALHSTLEKVRRHESSVTRASGNETTTLVPKISPWDLAVAAPDFVRAADTEVEMLEPRLLARGHITELFCPRGLGKTLVAHALGVKLARDGRRVLLVDRDNSPGEVRRRLAAWGGESNEVANLKVITREHAPDLWNKNAWGAFPVEKYDVLILDSLDSMAEGAGEKESAKPSRVLAPLLDVVRRENGPAVLVLGNTTKSAEHSRGCGVIEDRADIVYEVRDATDLKPSGRKVWWQELPEASNRAWRERAARRQKRDGYRLAFIASKYRLGPEPEPFLLELNLGHAPWTLTDVTHDVVMVVEAATAEGAKQAEEAHGALIAGLQNEIRKCADAGAPLRKGDDGAEAWLRERDVKRPAARHLLDDGDGKHWRIEKAPGKGAPKILLPVEAQCL